MPTASRNPDGPNRRPRPGFSLVEVLVALSILFTAITFFLVAIRGHETEGRKTAQYLNAVMVAQKVVDDIDNRCRENLHAVEEMTGLAGGGRVVDGGSPLFRYLEDTNANGRIDDDLAIVASAGSIYQQLKDFGFRVTFERGYGNGLARARVTVLWEDRGRPRSYEMVQVVQDLPARIDESLAGGQAIPVTDESIRLALFNEPGPLEELLARYHVDREVATTLAQVQVVVRSVVKRLAESDGEVLKIENSAKGSTREGIREIARQREENAIAIAQGFNLLAAPMQALDRLDGQGTLRFGELADNSCAVRLANDIGRLVKSLDGAQNPDCLGVRFNAELAGAMNLYLRLAIDPTVAKGLPYREKTGALMKIVELGSVLIQNNFNRMVFTIGEVKIPLLQLVTNTFELLVKVLGGRDYNRAAYVDAKLRAIKNNRFSEYEDVSSRVELMAAVSSIAGRVLQKFAVH